jgi:cell division protein FtsI (penicillin-binding protein 3)
VADVIGKRRITYDDKVYQGSFVGYFPSEQPRYTICVVIRTQPNSQAYYGGLIAAPVFRMIADKIYASTMGAWGGTIDSFSKKGGGRLTALKSTSHTYRTLMNAMQQPGISPSDVKDLMASLVRDSSDHQSVQTTKLDKVLVPDVRGMSLRDAVFMLENNGLQVKVRGKGRVSDQSVAPGTKIIKGQNIVLQLT